MSVGSPLLAGSVASQLVGGSVWTPSELTTLGWYDSDDAATIFDTAGAVDQWDDKSGNANNLTASGSDRPTTNLLTIGGLNVVDFNPTSTMKNNTLVLDDPCTVYAIGFNADTSSYCRLLNGGDTEDFRIFFGTLDGNASAFFGNGGSWNDVAANSPSESLATVAAFGFVNDAGTATPYVNGTAQNTKNGNQAVVTGINVGSYIGNSQHWDGPIAELVIVGSALDVSDRQKLEGYLAWKWDGGGSGTLVAALPGGHPYKAAPPTL